MVLYDNVPPDHSSSGRQLIHLPVDAPALHEKIGDVYRYLRCSKDQFDAYGQSAAIIKDLIRRDSNAALYHKLGERIDRKLET